MNKTTHWLENSGQEKKIWQCVNKAFVLTCVILYGGDAGDLELAKGTEKTKATILILNIYSISVRDRIHTSHLHSQDSVFLSWIC